MAGDSWEHTAVTAESTRVVRLVGGKRTQEQPPTLVHATQRRRRAEHVPAMFPEAYAGDASAILATFGRRYPTRAPGRAPRSIRRWPPGMAEGQVKKPYQTGRVERIAVRALYGKARLQHILSLRGYKGLNPSVVERHNGTRRLRNQRKVRKTLAGSQAPRSHRWMRWLSVGLYPLCRGHRSVKKGQHGQGQHRRPAMAARLTDHMWTIRAWLLCPVVGGQR